MNAERSVIGSVVFLAVGLGLLFGFTHGTAAFSAAYPVAGASFQVSLNTTGLPAMAGVVASVVGIVLLFVALIQSIVGQLARRDVQAMSRPAT